MLVWFHHHHQTTNVSWHRPCVRLSAKYFTCIILINPPKSHKNCWCPQLHCTKMRRKHRKVGKLPKVTQLVTVGSWHSGPSVWPQPVFMVRAASAPFSVLARPACVLRSPCFSMCGGSCILSACSLPTTPSFLFTCSDIPPAHIPASHQASQFVLPLSARPTSVLWK